MLLGFVVSQAIYVTAVLGIADLLADGPRSVTALAAATGADPDGLYRVLRLLAGHGIFTELPRGRFANSAHSQLLRETMPGSLRPLALAVGEGADPALAGTRVMVQAGRPSRWCSGRSGRSTWSAGGVAAAPAGAARDRLRPAPGGCRGERAAPGGGPGRSLPGGGRELLPRGPVRR
jgi:hypothetical protein